MKSFGACFSARCWRTVVCGAILCIAPAALAQGPSPETGSTLFPGGAYLSYESLFTTRRAPAISAAAAMLRPTLEHEGRFTFTWGFRRDFEFTVRVPVATRHFHFAQAPPSPSVGRTGLGDLSVTLKYRFLRLDSDRGTTQASVTFGPKFPTGRTGVQDVSGARLPAGLQPGSGSTDLLFGLNLTHTGLFNIHKLVADGSFLFTKRTEGSQHIQLGDSAGVRLWLSYRPYQTLSAHQELFIGPVLSWQHSFRDAQNGIRVPGSSGDVLHAGVVTYFSPRAGLHVWFSAEFPAASSHNGVFDGERRRFRFGVTRQFRLHR